jgi:cell shape-determining protein MreD
MKVAIGGAALVLLVLTQVAVAPLFPLRAAIPDLILVGVMVIALYWSPRPAMVAVPVVAVLFSFASDRAPGLVLLAYLPLLPAAYVLEQARLPINRYTQAAVATVVGGMAARLILAIGPMTQGAEFTFGVITKDLLLPGTVLDWSLLTLAYLPLRLAGLEASRMTLYRSNY